MCGRPHTSSSQTETTRCSVRCLTTRIHKLLSSPSLAVCSKVKLGCRQLAACVIQGAFNTTHPQGPCAFQASQTNPCKCCIPSLHMPSEKRGKKGLISTTVPEQHKYFVTAESLNRKLYSLILLNITRPHVRRRSEAPQLHSCSANPHSLTLSLCVSISCSLTCHLITERSVSHTESFVC